MVADRSFPNGSPVCDYWLSHCEGFAVRAGHRTLGIVERVDRGDDARLVQTLVLRARRRRRVLHTPDVLAVVPARKVILARRRQHAGPALRRTWRAVRAGLAVAGPVVQEQAAGVRRQSLRLARLTVADIRERNRQHVAPSFARAHRAANRYTFALNSRSREA
jgi:hypothetical protein